MMRRLLRRQLPTGLCLAVAALATQGCTRNYDGTVVPQYQVGMVRTGMLPRPVVQRTRLEPPDTGKIFPVAPLAPFPAEPAPRRQRSAIRSAPAQVQSGPPVRCRQPTDASGRIRMVCE